jgi:hypothetical protein
MTDSENFVDSLAQTDLPETFERVRDSTATLGISTASFARAISRVRREFRHWTQRQSAAANSKAARQHERRHR